MTKLIDRELFLAELESQEESLDFMHKSEDYEDGYRQAMTDAGERAKSLKLQDLEERIPVDSIAGVQLENKQKDSEDQKEFYSSVFETDRKVASQINFVKSVFGNGSKYSWLELNTRKGYVIKILLQEEEENDE